MTLRLDPLQALGAAMDDAVLADTLAREAVPVPWPSVARLVGPLAPGRLTLLTASTGAGKTTVLVNLAAALAEAGHGWTYCGTEMRSWELWRTWAAMTLVVPPGLATGGDWASLTPMRLQQLHDTRRYVDGPQVPRLESPAAVRAAVEAQELALQQRHGRHAVFADAPWPTVAVIREAAAAAAARGARLVIVDHAGRLELGDDYATQKRQVRALREVAAEYGVHLLVAIQQNRAARSAHRLAAYAPPQLTGLEGGGMWEHEAVCALGIWRPLRARREGESPKEYREAKAAVLADEAPLATILERNRVGVQLLKHRYTPFGVAAGDECRLYVHHGRITDPEAA